MCSGTSATAAPMGTVVLSSLACGLWAYCVCELVWVLALLLCSKTPMLLTFLQSTVVQTWLSVAFHFKGLIAFYLYRESNKCTVSQMLQIFLLFSSAYPWPTVSNRQRKADRKQLWSGACPDQHCLSPPLEVDFELDVLLVWPRRAFSVFLYVPTPLSVLR